MLSHNQLKQLNLQDIIVFLNLLELRSAKKTAEVMNISQPTVSYCLKKLRECFDDSLFNSIDGGMQPTNVAHSIAPHLQVMIQSINQCVDLDIDTSTQQKVWRLCAPEYFELTLLPTLIHKLKLTDNTTSLRIRRLENALPTEALIVGDIDIAIGFGSGYHQLHPNLDWQSVLTDDFCCLSTFAISGLKVNATLSLEIFCQSPQVFPTPWQSEKNMVDAWLESIGKRRNIIASANSYQACINIIAQTPATLALPRRLLPLLHIPENIQILNPPLGFPSFTLDMVWSKGRRHSPDIQALKGLILSSAP